MLERKSIAIKLGRSKGVGRKLKNSNFIVEKDFDENDLEPIKELMESQFS